MDFLYGIPIIIDNHITKTVRCKRHKKRRIDEKWLKMYGYKEVQDDSTIYKFDGKFLMSQKAYEKLKKAIDRHGKDYVCGNLFWNTSKDC